MSRTVFTALCLIVLGAFGGLAYLGLAIPDPVRTPVQQIIQP